MYAPWVLRLGLLAAMPSPVDIPVGGISVCPTPAGVWQELTSLLTQQDLRSRLQSANLGEPPVWIDDLGASFRVSVLGRERSYRDEGRDCVRRARIGALFAALVVNPSALAQPDNATPPQQPAPPPPPPAPAAPPVPTSVPAPAPAQPSKAKARLEAAAAMMGGADSQTWASGWGGAVRAVMGSGALGAVLGVGAFWPSDIAIAGVRLRQWRVPMDIGVRATITTARIDWYGELGLSAAVLGVRALDLLSSTSGAALELGARLSVAARLQSGRSVAPFFALSLDVIPDPPRVAALPMGTVGRTSHLWLGACLGMAWGIR